MFKNKYFMKEYSNVNKYFENETNVLISSFWQELLNILVDKGSSI